MPKFQQFNATVNVGERDSENKIQRNIFWITNNWCSIKCVVFSIRRHMIIIQTLWIHRLIISSLNSWDWKCYRFSKFCICISYLGMGLNTKTPNSFMLYKQLFHTGWEQLYAIFLVHLHYYCVLSKSDLEFSICGITFVLKNFRLCSVLNSRFLKLELLNLYKLKNTNTFVSEHSHDMHI